MKNLKAFLIWYNNKDGIQFLLALQKQFDCYADLGVDLFKDAISVPGITLRYLYRVMYVYVVLRKTKPATHYPEEQCHSWSLHHISQLP